MDNVKPDETTDAAAEDWKGSEFKKKFVKNKVTQVGISLNKLHWQGGIRAWRGGHANRHLKQRYELTMDEAPDSVEPDEMPTIAAEDYGDAMVINLC